MSIEIISDRVASPVGVFSQAMYVPPGAGLLFVSGITSKNASGELIGEGDIELQTRTMLTNIRSLLLEAGVDTPDIVKMTFYVRDIGDFDVIHRVRAEFFPHEPFPASAMVQVTGLVDSRYLIEADAIAVVPDRLIAGR